MGRKERGPASKETKTVIYRAKDERREQRLEIGNGS